MRFITFIIGIIVLSFSVGLGMSPPGPIIHNCDTGIIKILWSNQIVFSEDGGKSYKQIGEANYHDLKNSKSKIDNLCNKVTNKNYFSRVFYTTSSYIFSNKIILSIFLGTCLLLLFLRKIF